ncbi:hypothetical protein SAMD00020551_1994 [Mesobacillus selenatarsenatis SF-1]|uniref:Uncharacterized protein n=1 Tax=Mesobacillus selenatarsenatis (strain DSM 18680 / JCM 14380 / FERM P-15431 / SF-1) TaxID=1321606 RepID=A0A0A8X497_MESS1|nr:hypothetical protein SAMD00020551_1994 [Mesobacillus selenatarsenatis SF-1]
MQSGEFFYALSFAIGQAIGLLHILNHIELLRSSSTSR